MNTSSRPDSNYAFEYSRRVVYLFLDRYSRATYFLAKMLYMDPKRFVDGLINCFQHHQVKWRVVKQTIKMVHNENMYEDIARLDYPDRVKYLTCVKTMAEDYLLDSKKL